MGLDMYLWGRESKHFDDPRVVDDKGRQVVACEIDLGYWRKHPNLHGFIVDTFADGVDECQRIALDVEDIEKIIHAINAKALPYTEGFFFGKSENTEAEAAFDRKVFMEALEWIAEKPMVRRVIYQASW